MYLERSVVTIQNNHYTQGILPGYMKHSFQLVWWDILRRTITLFERNIQQSAKQLNKKTWLNVTLTQYLYIRHKNNISVRHKRVLCLLDLSGSRLEMLHISDLMNLYTLYKLISFSVY
jgi:hypothetical protein